MITPMLRELTASGNELYVGMLACGALVTKLTARGELVDRLKESVVLISSIIDADFNPYSMGASHGFAFSTKTLQPTLTTLFFYNFVHRVLIEGVPLDKRNIATVLDQAVFIARHTPLFHFYRETEEDGLTPKFTIVEYVWTHNTMRPNGRDIGIQCPECGTLASRTGKRKDTSREDRRVVVWCKVTGCKWEETYFIKPNVLDLKTGENGLWTARELTDSSS